MEKALYIKPLPPVQKPVQNVYNFSTKENSGSFMVNYPHRNTSNFLQINAIYCNSELHQDLQNLSTKAKPPRLLRSIQIDVYR